MDNSVIIGKEVAFYLEGGWQISGKVKIFEEQKIIIESKGILTVVFRSKISAMSVLQNSNDSRPGHDYPVPEGRPVRSGADFPMNGISYDDSTLSIPSSLVGAKNEDEFSVFFGDDKHNSKISFGINDDTMEKD
tara:strand:- start:14339 stop:14740 length:402 start_codon:yes stop_codon:yes gene_type:complete